MEKIGDFELNKIYCIDCLEGLKKLPDNSIDLIITDPPYNIGKDLMLFGLSAITAEVQVTFRKKL